MTSNQQKETKPMTLDQALAQYETQGKYHVLVTNYFQDFLEQYDALIAQGYKTSYAHASAANVNLSVMQIAYLEKPAKVQKAETAAIKAEYN